MKTFLGYMLVIAIIGVATTCALGSYVDLPTVEESYSTQECVRVLLADGTEGSCDDLPEKYHHVWVQ